jgi:hypothetical protein
MLLRNFCSRCGIEVSIEDNFPDLLIYVELCMQIKSIMSCGRSGVLSVRIPIVPQVTKMQMLSTCLLDFNSSKSEILNFVLGLLAVDS